MECSEEAHVEIRITRTAHRVEPRSAKPRLRDRLECGLIEPGVVDADAAEDLHFVFHLIGALWAVRVQRRGARRHRERCARVRRHICVYLPSTRNSGRYAARIQERLARAKWQFV